MVPIKIVLQKRKFVEHHRVRGTFTWDELVSFISYIVNWPNVTVEYTDNDNDTIEISSQPEWEECLRLYEQSIEGAGSKQQSLRLTVRRSHHQKPSCIPRLRLAPHSTTPSPPVAHYVQFDSVHDEDLMDILSAAFRCDASALVFNTPLDQPLPWPVTTERSTVGDRIALSVDMGELRDVVLQITQFRESSSHTDLVRYEGMLTVALRLFADDPQVELRAAELKEKLGKRESAIRLLNRAKSLRLSQEQQRLLQGTSALQSLLGTESAPPPPAPVDYQRVLDESSFLRQQQIRQLLMLFPKSDASLIAELLQILHGDVKAVSKLL